MDNENNSVKNLVISGGGPSIFSIFGAVKYLHETTKTWNIHDLQSIYACSSGALLGVCICLMKIGLTLEEIESYLITRCWRTLLTNEVLDIRTAFETKGLFDVQIIKKVIGPLLQTVGLSNEITLQQLFDSTKIKLVSFAVNINVKPLEKVHVSHLTFPELPVYKALSITMGLPGIIAPTFIGEMCLIDGGLMANYPYIECHEESDGGNILGFKIKWENRQLPIDSKSNIVAFLAHLMKMMALHIDTHTNIIPEYSNLNTVHCVTPYAGNPTDWLDLFGDKEMRKQYVDAGIESAKVFIASQKEKNQQTQPESHT